MWEAIARNRRRSALLITILGCVLAALGASIGYYAAPNERGAEAGFIVAMVIWFFMWMLAAFAGDDILLATSGGHRIEKQDAPLLWNVVEEMTIAAGLPVMPAVYVIENDEPNAFAVGQRPDRAAVAVTSGLIRRLDRDEMQGVIGHEIGHIRNLDIRFMTRAAVMVGAVTILSDVFLRNVRFGGGRRSSRDNDSRASGAIIVLVLIVAILAPIAARLLYLACSREREYLADASSARFTRNPTGLASALDKIAAAPTNEDRVSGALAPMYIINPLQRMAAAGLFSTHPPTEKRTAILRNMAGKAGLIDYEAAFERINGKKILGAKTLAAADSVDAQPSGDEAASPVDIDRAAYPTTATPADAADEDTVARSREVHNFLGRMARFITIPCPCGVNIKVPPNYDDAVIQCPKCGTLHNVPFKPQTSP